MNLLLGEIEEVGRKLAQLVRSKRLSADRAKRTEIRALLRKALLATQEDQSTECLRSMLNELQKTLSELVCPAPSVLAERVGRHDDFGALDWHFTKGDQRFQMPNIESADKLAGLIQDRLNKILRSLKELSDEESQEGMGRPLRTSEEAKELVTKRV